MSFRLGIIGLGEIAEYHIKAILNTPGMNIVGVCDIDSTKAEDYACQLGIKAFSNYEELYEQKLNAAVICLPHNLHHTVAMGALRSSCHVIIEKPLALNLQQCKDIISFADMKGLRIFVTDIASFGQGPQLTRKEYLAGRLGRFMAGNICCVRDYFSGKRSWHLDNNQSGGGMLINVGVHRMAAFKSAVPALKPLEVLATIEKKEEYSVEACSSLLVKYSPHGSVFYQNIGYYPQSDVNINFTELFFEKGRISWNANEWQMVTLDGEAVTKPISKVENPYEQVYRTMMLSLCDVKKAEYPSVEIFAEDIAIIDAGYKSAALGNSVKVQQIVDVLKNQRYCTDFNTRKEFRLECVWRL